MTSRKPKKILMTRLRQVGSDGMCVAVYLLKNYTKKRNVHTVSFAEFDYVHSVSWMDPARGPESQAGALLTVHGYAADYSNVHGSEIFAYMAERGIKPPKRVWERKKGNVKRANRQKLSKPVRAH